MEEERKYGLIYEDDIIADNITMEIALILIKALCEKNYEEVSHSFMLVVKNTLSTVGT